MCNKKYIGKFYAEDILSEKDGFVFLCDVYSEETDDTKFYAKLNDGSIFEVLQDSPHTFNLQIDIEHQYNLKSEEIVISEE